MSEFEIVSLLVSPLRRFEGRPADGPAPYDPSTGLRTSADETVDSAEVRAHKGLVGDRYFGTRFTFASVTLISEEAIRELEGTLGDGPFDPVLARRNVVTRGLDVDALARTSFTIDAGHGPIEFRSMTPANPCAWMNEMYAPGAHAALRGHGGIRSEPLTSGFLRVGPATITGITPIPPEELRRRIQSATV